MARSTADDNIGWTFEAVATETSCEGRRIVAIIVPYMRAALANAG